MTAPKLSATIFILTLYSSLVSTVVSACPTGWTQYNTRCYRIEVRQWVSYNEAVKGCAGRGAVLAGLPDQQTTQFISGLSNTSWSQLNQCRLQARDCLLSTQSTSSRFCSERPCLGLWVGLDRLTPCGTSCAADTLRSGWAWLDGSSYSATGAPWGNQQPLDDRVSIRFAVQDSTMTMTMGSYDQTWRYGYICSRSIDSTAYPGPEYPEEGSGDYEWYYQDESSNVKLGLAIGLSVGGSLLIVLIIGIIFIVRDCSRPVNKKMRKMKEEDGASDSVDLRETRPVYYHRQRNTFYGGDMDPYRLEPPNYEDGDQPEAKNPDTYA